MYFCFDDEIYSRVLFFHSSIAVLCHVKKYDHNHPFDDIEHEHWKPNSTNKIWQR